MKYIDESRSKNGVVMKTTVKHRHHQHHRQFSLTMNAVLLATACRYCRLAMVLAFCCCRWCCVALLLCDISRVSAFMIVDQSYHHHQHHLTTNGNDNDNNNNKKKKFLTRNNYHGVRSRRQMVKIWQNYGKKNNNDDDNDDEITMETSGDVAVPDFDSLIDMDVVVYSFVDDPLKEKRFAAVQEDGILSPLSVWTTECAFGNSMEFLVDEEERFKLADDVESRRIELHYLIDESSLSYGSRQCQRGVSNPHGEENELLYYIDKDVIERFDAKFDVKPELEILW